MSKENVYKIFEDIKLLQQLQYDAKRSYDFKLAMGLNNLGYEAVIRCKDCKYYGQFSCTHPCIQHLCNEDDYCSYGEKRGIDNE